MKVGEELHEIKELTMTIKSEDFRHAVFFQGHSGKKSFLRGNNQDDIMKKQALPRNHFYKNAQGKNSCLCRNGQ